MEERKPKWWVPILFGAMLSGAVGITAGGAGSYLGLREAVAVKLAELEQRAAQNERAIEELKARPGANLDGYVKREELNRAVDGVYGRIDRMESRLDKRLDQVLEILTAGRR